MGEAGRCLPFTFMPDRIQSLRQNPRDLSYTDRNEEGRSKGVSGGGCSIINSSGYGSDDGALRTVGDSYTQMYVLGQHALMTFDGGVTFDDELSCPFSGSVKGGGWYFTRLNLP